MKQSRLSKETKELNYITERLHERVGHRTPGLAPFACPKCEERFSRLRVLKQHIHEEHPEHLVHEEEPVLAEAVPPVRIFVPPPLEPTMIRLGCALDLDTIIQAWDARDPDAAMRAVQRIRRQSVPLFAAVNYPEPGLWTFDIGGDDGYSKLHQDVRDVGINHEPLRFVEQFVL